MSYKNKKITVVKIYLKHTKRPITIETNKSKEEFVERLMSDINSNVLVKIGPVVFSVDEFLYFTYE